MLCEFVLSEPPIVTMIMHNLDSVGLGEDFKRYFCRNGLVCRVRFAEVDVAQITVVIGEDCANVIPFLGKNPLELSDKTWSSALQLINTHTFPWFLSWKNLPALVGAAPWAPRCFSVDTGGTW